LIGQIDKRIDESVAGLMGVAAANGSDLVVFPEGLTPPSESVPPTGPFGEAPPATVIFGGTHTVDGKNYQSAYAYDGEWHVADKTRLVIFGEFVPFRGLSILDRFDLPSGDLVEADELTTLEVRGTKVGAMLCFEGLFPDIGERHARNGANMLAVMAIDDWYEGTTAQEQLYSASVWRSIEAGMPVARAASKGYSFITDYRGRIQTMATYGEMMPIRAEVAVPERPDGFPFRFAFVWVCWLACLATLAHHVVSIIRKPKS